MRTITLSSTANGWMRFRSSGSPRPRRRHACEAYPDSVYWRYANTFSKRIVVEGQRVAKVTTIVPRGRRKFGFTVGRASIRGAVYDFEPTSPADTLH